MFSHLEEILLSYIHSLPLELFAFIASFIEEVIAPIPSPSVMMLTGSFASVNGYTLGGLVILTLIAACGKSLGAIVVYYVSYGAEDFIMKKFGRFFGVTTEDVTAFGKKFGNGWRDYLLLTFFRALPIVPSSLVSIGSGLLKIPFKLFIIATFVGTIIRDGVYLYVGFVGTEFLHSLITQSTSVESIVEVFGVFLFVFFFGYLYFKRKKA